MKSKPLSDREILGVVKDRIDTAVKNTESANALRQVDDNLYYGLELGDEREGWSQVISRDVAESIDSIMPGLMRIFTSGSTVVKFDPTNADDVEQAKQATDYVNYIWDKKNTGFLNFHTWFKDALMHKLGVVKVTWEDKEDSTPENYKRKTIEEIAMLEEDPDLEVGELFTLESEFTEGPNGEQIEVKLYDVDCRRQETVGQVKVECIPLDEFIYDSTTVDPDDSKLVGQKTTKTVSDLIADGFDEKKVASIPTETTENTGAEDGAGDPSMREVEVTDAYIRIDANGDGIAELRRFVIGGDSTMLLNEEVDTQPYAVITPVLMPHQLAGVSITDQTEDIQVVKSTLQRQMLDNLYLTNKPRVVVDPDQIDIDDLLNPEIGGLVRTTEGGSIAGVREIVTPFTAGQSFPMIEYYDGVREQRTGVSRLNQGLDADSLNKTATGINLVQQAGLQRQELIARVFAETGVRQAFRKIYELVCKYQDKEDVILLRGEWVPINPSDWSSKRDLSVVDGIGTGDKQQKTQALMMMAQIDEKLIQLQGGVQGPILTMQGIYNKIDGLAESVGLHTDVYYQDPSKLPPKPPAAPKPDPAMLALQMQQQLATQDMQQKFALQQEELRLKTALKAQEAQSTTQINEYKAKSAAEVDQYQAKAGVEIDAYKAKASSELDMNKAITNAEIEMKKAEEKALLERDQAEEKAILDRAGKTEQAVLDRDVKIEHAKLDREQSGQNIDNHLDNIT